MLMLLLLLSLLLLFQQVLFSFQFHLVIIRTFAVGRCSVVVSFLIVIVLPMMVVVAFPVLLLLLLLFFLFLLLLYNSFFFLSVVTTGIRIVQVFKDRMSNSRSFIHDRVASLLMLLGRFDWFVFFLRLLVCAYF